jgi:hypothetical protein
MTDTQSFHERRIYSEIRESLLTALGAEPIAPRAGCRPAAVVQLWTLARSQPAASLNIAGNLSTSSSFISPCRRCGLFAYGRAASSPHIGPAHRTSGHTLAHGRRGAGVRRSGVSWALGGRQL